VFTFRGTADTAVPYGGGSISTLTNIGAQATFQKWAAINQCTGSPSAEDSNGCSTYSSCAGGIQVTLCTKQGGGHDPGTASVSWPVLKKYTLP
jgi:polyhydroxybutyrate depolymerase